MPGLLVDEDEGHCGVAALLLAPSVSLSLALSAMFTARLRQCNDSCLERGCEMSYVQ